MASKLCDSCRSATAALYCRTDSAFLCLNCDAKIHAANKLASRHGRVLICEVCEQAPAHVTCKADAASLCITCDSDIHSANPLACRHERVPVTVFFDSVKDSVMNFFDDRYGIDDTDLTEWLIPNGKVVESDEVVNNNGQCWFADVDPYLDVDFGSIDPKLEVVEQISSGNNDCVVPVHNKSLQGSFVHDNCYEIDFTESKPFAFGSFNTSQSVSLSSLEVGMVPDGGMEGTNERVVMQLKGVDREARVMRYREKRKNRKFEKTIRYASRKAYAETRPRIKGRFAKRTEVELEVEDVDSSLFAFGVVPSF